MTTKVDVDLGEVECEVQTLTFVTYEDGRPTEVIFSGTDETVPDAAATVTPLGSAMLSSFIQVFVNPECLIKTEVEDGAAG